MKLLTLKDTRTGLYFAAGTWDGMSSGTIQWSNDIKYAAHYKDDVGEDMDAIDFVIKQLTTMYGQVFKYVTYTPPMFPSMPTTMVSESVYVVTYGNVDTEGEVFCCACHNPTRASIIATESASNSCLDGPTGTYFQVTKDDDDNLIVFVKSGDEELEWWRVTQREVL